MITREDLEKRYTSLSNKELLEIVEDKFAYTELAIVIALEEISRRKLDENDIKKFKEGSLEKLQTLVDKCIFDDLTFLQKIMFFFLWFPFLNFIFKRNFIENDFILKLKQANYYSWCGFIFCIVTMIIKSQFNLPELFWVSWIISFLIAYEYDEFFNRKNQIEQLKKIFGDHDVE